MCVLRVSGKDFQPDDFLKNSSFHPTGAFYRGQARLPLTQPDGKRNETSGFNLDVSDGDWGGLGAQTEDAIGFLQENRLEVERLVHFPGVEDVSLDFPLELRIGEKIWAQSDRFRADLVKLAGGLGIALEDGE
jgi:hypothetical protein